MSTITTYGCQCRFVDPFAPVDSDVVSQLTAIYSASGRGILQGFELSADPTVEYYLNLSKGIIVKDYIVIRYLSDLQINLTYFNLTPSVKYYVVLDYEYKKVSPPPVAGIVFVTDAEYDETKHLKLGTVMVNSDSHILELTNEGREYGDIINQQTVNETINNSMESAIQSFSIGCLCDVNTLTQHDGYTLAYDEATGEWVSKELVIDVSNVNLSFLNLTDAPNTYTDKQGLFLRVNSTQTGLEFAAVGGSTYLPGGVGGSSSDIYLNNLVDVNFTGPQDKDVLTYNSILGIWESSPSQVASCFTCLYDTPSNYIGADGNVVCVQGNALVFTDLDSKFSPLSHTHVWSDINKTGSSISDLSNVDATNPINNDILVYDSGSSEWKATQNVSATKTYVDNNLMTKIFENIETDYDYYGFASIISTSYINMITIPHGLYAVYVEVTAQNAGTGPSNYKIAGFLSLGGYTNSTGNTVVFVDDTIINSTTTTSINNAKTVVETTASANYVDLYNFIYDKDTPGYLSIVMQADTNVGGSNVTLYAVNSQADTSNTVKVYLRMIKEF